MRGSANREGSLAWCAMLRAERLRARLTQRDLGVASGVSADAVRKYESGERAASRDRLLAMLEAMAVPESRASAVLGAAGFAAAAAASGEGDRFYLTLDEARASLDDVPWPKLLVDDALEVLAANVTAAALFPAAALRRRHLLAVIAWPEVAGRIANLDAVLASLIGLAKRAIPDGYPARGDALLDECFAANPTIAAPLLDLWDATAATSVRSRSTYRVSWCDDSGPLEFVVLVTACGERGNVMAHEWHPADAASHARLEQVLAGRPAAGGRALPGDPPAGIRMLHASRR